MATQKELFVNRLLQVAQKFAYEVMDEVENIDSQYFDNGYDGGGSDPIIDADLANYNDLTAAQVALVITAFQQLDNFANNAVVATGDYSVTFNTVRDAKIV